MNSRDKEGEREREGERESEEEEEEEEGGWKCNVGRDFNLVVMGKRNFPAVRCQRGRFLRSICFIRATTLRPLVSESL